MVVLADWMDENMVADAIENTSEVLDQALIGLRIEEMHEGRCIQIMHEGSPEHVSELTTKIYQDYLPSNNLVPNGSYHEIYLTDARRVASNKMRMIVRQPVSKSDI